MKQEPVTVIITSCGRPDLLSRTLTTFFHSNNYPITEYYLNEDSGNNEIISYINQQYPFIKCFNQPVKLGLSASLDLLLSKAKTEWIFNIEDDWEFNPYNPNFIHDSLKILQARPDIHQVWIRGENDFEHPLSKEIEFIEGIPIKKVTKGYLNLWSGFSLNPSLRNINTLKWLFPEGLNNEGPSEEKLSIKAIKKGYNAVCISDENSATIKHIGWNRHTPNFKH